MRISLNTVLVEDQQQALDFYTGVLGFEKKSDIPLGEFRWLTVVSSAEPNGTQLVLEPTSHPAAAAYQRALFDDGIPLTSFAVEDIDTEYARLVKAGVVFKGEPTVGDVRLAVFEDTCGNLIQIYEET